MTDHGLVVRSLLNLLGIVIEILSISDTRKILVDEQRGDFTGLRLENEVLRRIVIDLLFTKRFHQRNVVLRKQRSLLLLDQLLVLLPGFVLPIIDQLFLLLLGLELFTSDGEGLLLKDDFRLLIHVDIRIL